MNRPSVGLFLGRPERSAFLARKLRERGFEVTHYNVSGFGEDPWVPVRPGLGHEIAHVLARTRHDVYLTGLSHAPALSLAANRWLRGRPFVFNATGAKWEMFRDQSRSRRFPAVFERIVHPLLLRATYRSAGRIVTNSRFLARKIAARDPAVADRLETIYNGIDADRYATGRPVRLPHVRAGDVVALCVTTINFEHKAAGLGLVLDAFDRARRRVPRLRLVVAAKADHASYREDAVRRVAALASAEAIDLRFNDEDVPGLLAAADLFVFATPDDSNDSLPRALIEAQVAGLAALTTATSGCPEIVADGETGRVVAYESEALAEALVGLATDRLSRARMAARARARAMEVFDWNRMADGYARIFQELAA
jgi:glycosyltransferase involved in cell wall biosynthesis